MGVSVPKWCLRMGKGRAAGFEKGWRVRFWLSLNPGGSDSKKSAQNAGDRVLSLGWEDLPEKEMVTYCSILAWRIPWTEEPGSYSPQGHKDSDNWATITFTFKPFRGLLSGATGKEPTFNAGDKRDPGLISGSGSFLKEGMATHSSIFAWRILRTEEPGRLPSIRSQRAMKRLSMQMQTLILDPCAFLVTLVNSHITGNQIMFLITSGLIIKSNHLPPFLIIICF